MFPRGRILKDTSIICLFSLILNGPVLSYIILVRVHILDPAALAISSQALVSFWPDGDVEAGNVIDSALTPI